MGMGMGMGGVRIMTLLAIFSGRHKEWQICIKEVGGLSVHHCSRD